jgi:hypothetical protein
LEKRRDLAPYKKKKKNATMISLFSGALFSLCSALQFFILERKSSSSEAVQMIEKLSQKLHEAIH